MEMQFNGMILRGKYLLVTNNRPIRSSDNGVYEFVDGSKADLNLGLIVLDTKSGTSQALFLHKLTLGKQTISTGIKNENPETKLWQSKKLDIDYDGDIIVSPTTNSQVTVTENEFCFAKQEDNTILITSANYTTLTIDTINTSISNISGGNKPALRITAPIDTTIINRAGRLIFVQLDTITLFGGNVDGNKANTISGTTSSRSAISVQDLGTLSLNAKGSLTINIGSAKLVDITSNSRIDLTVKVKIDNLIIDNSSATNIMEGRYQDINIKNSGGRLEILDFDSIQSLTISAGSAVKVSGTNCNTVNVTDTKRNRVDITITNSELVKLSKTGAVAIKGEILKTIVVDIANSRVDIEVNQSDSITVKGQSAVNISGLSIDYLEIQNDSRVDVIAKKLGGVSVTSTSAVNVNCEESEQTVSVTTKSRVDLHLAVAKRVTVNTNSAVSVSALKYLTEPIIITSGRKSIEKRK